MWPSVDWWLAAAVDMQLVSYSTVGIVTVGGLIEASEPIYLWQAQITL